jgi:diacylglycerol O-acyltransferase
MLHLVPLFHRRLLPVPFGLDQPYWVEDPHPSLDHHVRELALPEPGDDHQLAVQVARLHAVPLDRSRPLWELYLITGLQGGRAAVYSKIHHAAMDGVSGDGVVALAQCSVADQTARQAGPGRARAGGRPHQPGHGSARPIHPARWWRCSVQSMQ